MVIVFADLLEALSAAPVILAHQPSAVEVMDKAILDNTRQNAALDRIRNIVHRRRSRRHAVRGILRAIAKKICRRACDALEEDLRARKSRLSLPRARPIPPRRRASGACAKPRWGFPWR